MSEPLSDKQLDKIREELAKHRRWGRAAICCHCGEPWPCTSQSYTGLLAEVDRLRAQVCRCPDDRIRLGHHLGHDAVERAARALCEQRYGWGDNEEWTDPDVQEIYNEEARAALIAAGPDPADRSDLALAKMLLSESDDQYRTPEKAFTSDIGVVAVTGNRLPGNPAANTAISIVLAPICVLLVVGARINNWWHAHAIARAERRDTRRRRRLERRDSLGCIEDNEGGVS